MRVIAKKFGSEMDRLCGYVDLVMASARLSKVSTAKLMSRHPFTVAALNVNRCLLPIGNFTVIAFDGSYLTACAEFELTVRELMESYVQKAVVKCPRYNQLPIKIREWYYTGCANLLINLHKDKFKHLTKEDIVNSVATCVKGTRYHLVEEAFSNHDRNFKPDLIEEHFKRIGIDKVWQKIAREKNMQTSIGANNESITEQAARIKLTEIMQRRNYIMHRGKSYYTPSETDIKGSATYLKYLTENMAEVMEKQLAAI